MDKMKYFKDERSFSRRKFLVLVNRRKHGTPAGIGVGIYDDMSCDVCGHTWRVRKKLGTKGHLECPICGIRCSGYTWLYISPEVGGGDGSALYPVGWDNEDSDMALN
jgi:hypothetical protein